MEELNPNASSGRLKALPMLRAELEIDATIDAEAMALIKAGYTPQQPQDKWLLHMDEADWLHVYRAASGSCIFSARFESAGAHTVIAEAWVNRDSREYKGQDAAYDARLFIYLVRKLLLKHSVPFPMPANLPHGDKVTHEQHVMGASEGGASFIPLNILNGTL